MKTSEPFILCTDFLCLARNFSATFMGWRNFSVVFTDAALVSITEVNYRIVTSHWGYSNGSS